MTKKQSQNVWVYSPPTPKFTAFEKESILTKVKTTIKALPKLSQRVSRVDMRGHRIYLYELVEQIYSEGAIFTRPLIDDKYLEYPYARITLLDKQGDNCTLDWQRHNDQWVTLFPGTLIELINFIEEDNCWF